MVDLNDGLKVELSQRKVKVRQSTGCRVNALIANYGTDHVMAYVMVSRGFQMICHL
jgi:hypothetical protein